MRPCEPASAEVGGEFEIIGGPGAVAIGKTAPFCDSLLVNPAGRVHCARFFAPGCDWPSGKPFL
jgi:hypothetical protein